MAYPTISAPYGLKPINLIGGTPFAGATRQFAIASAYDTSIYNGDVVQLGSAGSVIKSTLDDENSPVAGVVGVFVGCSYTDPTLKYKLFSQYFPANTVASDIVAYVADDPNQLYKAVNVAGTTADDATSGLLPAYLSRTVIGSNCRLVLNAGDANTGNSKIAVYTAAGATTSSLGFRIVDVVPDTANASGNFCEFIVKFNFGYHSYLNATGV